MNAKRYDAALKTARDIQAQHKDSAVGYAVEADVLVAQGQIAAATKAYEQAYVIGKTGPILLKLHKALKDSGKEKEAEAKLAQWIKENPNDIAARLYAGTESLMSNQPKVAIAHFQVALKSDPKNVFALNNIALAYQAERDPQAVKYAEQALALAPKSAAVLDTLGWLLIEQKDVAKGIAYVQQALAIQPDAQDIRYHLALGLIKSGDKARARAELEHLLASKQSFAKSDEAQRLLKTL